jgi:hypothetical protein
MSNGLGMSDHKQINQVGHALEVKAFEWLCENAPGQDWKHLNGKGVFDILGKDVSFDVVSIEPGGTLRTEHKCLCTHIRIARVTGKKGYLMFPYQDDWGFLLIHDKLAAKSIGTRINTSRMRVKTLKDLNLPG